MNITIGQALPNINEALVRTIIEVMEEQLCFLGYSHKVESLRRQLKQKTISILQQVHNLKIFKSEVFCNINLHDHNTHFITENILTQNTYYKILTSRP